METLWIGLIFYKMKPIEILSLVITALCVISFSIVFTVLFRRFYLHNIEDVKAGKQDIELLDNAVAEEKAKKNKNRKIARLVVKIVSYVALAGVAFVFAVAIYGRFTNNTMLLGNRSLVVIASGSMSERNKDNTYLDYYNLNNQFNTYDIIGISKYKNQDAVKQYDVVAFKNTEGKTIVHRIIDIKIVGTEIRYDTRGDSNNASDNGTQYQGYLSFKDIIGYYNGFRMQNVGIFVIFLQSNAGIITILAVVYCLFMFDHYNSKYEAEVDKRTKLLVELLKFNLQEERKDEIITTYLEQLTFQGKKFVFLNGEVVEQDIEKLEENSNDFSSAKPQQNEEKESSSLEEGGNSDTKDYNIKDNSSKEDSHNNKQDDHTKEE